MVETIMEKIERQGTINDINDLYEDGYEELYLDMCQHFEYERECNEKLKKENNELWRLLGYILSAKEIMNDDYIEKQNELIKKYRKKMDNIIQKYKK
jgi:hypothetical protein